MKSIALWIAAFGSRGRRIHPVSLVDSLTYDTPYATPLVEKPSAEDAGTFHGLLSLAQSLPPRSALKVLWTHGMCTHPSRLGRRPDEAARRPAIGGTVQTVSVRPVGAMAPPCGRNGHGPAKIIDVMFLSWSPLTTPYKTALTYDYSTHYGGDFPYARATLNPELKRGLINDCMTDVVVYSGAKGADIHQAAEEAVCDVIGGPLSMTPTCNVPPGELIRRARVRHREPGQQADLRCHPGSLGLTRRRTTTRRRFDRVANSLAATRMMYMVANQLPLLDAAGTTIGRARGPLGQCAASPGAAEQHPGRLRPLHPRPLACHRPPPEPMTLVAFSDPNDLLTYRIVPAPSPRQPCR